jgi:5-methylcytosine-specific restriction endonuclease McrA
LPGRRSVSAELRALVQRRARGLCEYCHAPEAWQYVEFNVEHIVPVVAGGETTAANLALCCFSCNRRKWDRQSGVDPAAGREHRLFHPRADDWNAHFAWSRDGLSVLGQTAVGRAMSPRWI